MPVVFKRLSAAVGLGLLVSLTACHAQAPVLSGPAERVEAPVVAGHQAHGSVSLRVLWPVRAAYRTQAIPANANSIVLEVLSEDGAKLLARGVVERPPGGALVSEATLDEVPAASNLLVRVTAYLDEKPGLGSPVLALGTARVNVLPSSVSVIEIELTALNGPIITSMPANSGPNTFILVSGSNFDSDTPVSVTFGGVPSPQILGGGSGAPLQVLVPENALDGPLVVTANGVAGAGAFPFRIIRKLALSPDSAPVSVGVPVSLNAVFALSAKTASGDAIPNPVVTSWSCGYVVQPGGVEDKENPLPALPSVTADGVLTASQAGTFRVSAWAGSVEATADIVVN
ncbi:hypothetical protein J7643_14045 [bacterium]|nr:hypothetical protein [bacterium]